MKNNKNEKFFIDDSFLEEISNMSNEQLQMELEKAKEIIQNEEPIRDEYYNKDSSYERFLLKVKDGKKENEKKIKSRLHRHLKVASFFAVSIIMMLAVVGSVQAVNNSGEVIVGVVDGNEIYLEVNSTKAMLEGYSLTNEVVTYSSFEEVNDFSQNAILVLDGVEEIQLNIQMRDDFGEPLVAYFFIKYVKDDLKIESFIQLRDVPDLLVAMKNIENEEENFNILLEGRYEVTITKYDNICVASFDVGEFEYYFKSECSVEEMEAIIKSLEQYYL